MRHLRLATGLVMLTYVTMHLVNHALGLVSLALAEQGLRAAIFVWHSVPGTVALYGAFIIHFGLALRTIHQRRNWRLPLIEWVRLWAGFSLPLLLVGHAVGTRVAASFYGVVPSYGKVISGLVQSGAEGWQIALLAPGWVHGCLGVWIGLRHFAAMQRIRWGLAAFVVALPLLAAAGFIAMSVEVGASQALVASQPKAPAADAESLRMWRQGLIAAYLALVATAFAAGRLSRSARAP